METCIVRFFHPTCGGKLNGGDLVSKSWFWPNTSVYHHSSLQGTSEWHLYGMVLVPGHNYSKTLLVLPPDKKKGTFKFQTL
jgi:hypothetical protein